MFHKCWLKNKKTNEAKIVIRDYILDKNNITKNKDFIILVNPINIDILQDSLHKFVECDTLQNFIDKKNIVIYAHNKSYKKFLKKRKHNTIIVKKIEPFDFYKNSDTWRIV